MSNPSEQRLSIGDRVVLRSSRECGIVLLVWTNEHGDRDCYVAFYGHAFPDTALLDARSDKQPPRPYILRYYEASLEKQP